MEYGLIEKLPEHYTQHVEDATLSLSHFNLACSTADTSTSTLQPFEIFLNVASNLLALTCHVTVLRMATELCHERSVAPYKRLVVFLYRKHSR